MTDTDEGTLDQGEVGAKLDPPKADVTGDPVNDPPERGAVPALRDEARGEMRDLAGHWNERLADFDASDAGGIGYEQRSLWQDAVRRFKTNRIALFGLAVIVLYVLLAAFAPLLAEHVLVPGEDRARSATKIDYAQAQEGPSVDHWFGTNPQGKDMFLLVWEGARISLSIALAVALVILAIGMLYGSIAGYVGGRVDNLMMRFLDALYGLPYLPFAIITVTVVRDSFPSTPPLVYMVPALTITAWFTAARIMRGQMLSLKSNEYVEGAKAAGASGARVVGRHVIPNAVGVMVVAIFLEIPNAILAEAFLSFLGLGVQPPSESWGTLAEEGYVYINAAPHLMWVPAFFIASTVLAAIAVADGVRDALDPRGHVH